MKDFEKNYRFSGLWLGLRNQIKKLGWFGFLGTLDIPPCFYSDKVKQFQHPMTTYLPLEKRAGNVQSNGSSLFLEVFLIDLYCNFVLPTICLDPISVKICVFNGWARFETIWIVVWANNDLRLF